jgi:hypothetical protein
MYVYVYIDMYIHTYVPLQTYLGAHILISIYIYTEELERMRNSQKYFEGDEENLKYSYFYPEVILYRYTCMYICVYT